MSLPDNSFEQHCTLASRTNGLLRQPSNMAVMREWIAHYEEGVERGTIDPILGGRSPG